MGSFKNKEIILNTQSFIIIEVVLLINILKIKFYCTTYMERGSVTKLYKDLKPYIIKSMEYKFIGKN